MANVQVIYLVLLAYSTDKENIYIGLHTHVIDLHKLFSVPITLLCSALLLQLRSFLFACPFITLVSHADTIQSSEIRLSPYDKAMFLLSRDQIS